MNRKSLIILLLFFSSPWAFSQDKIPWQFLEVPQPRNLVIPLDAGNLDFTQTNYSNLHGPQDFRYDQKGNLYILDYNKMRIVVLDKNEKFLKIISLPKEYDYINTFGHTYFFSVQSDETIVLQIFTNKYLFLNPQTEKYRILVEDDDLSYYLLTVTPQFFAFFAKNEVKWAEFSDFIDDPKSFFNRTYGDNETRSTLIKLKNGEVADIDYGAKVVRYKGRIYPTERIDLKTLNPTANSEKMVKAAEPMGSFLGFDKSNNMYFSATDQFAYVVNPLGKIIAPIGFKKLYLKYNTSYYGTAVKPNGTIVLFQTVYDFYDVKKSKILMFEYPRTW